MTITDEQFAELVSKVDTLKAAIEVITPKKDTETVEKTDARDVSLEKGKAYFLTQLKDILPKEKLDTLSFNELLLAAELKATIQPANLNPATPATVIKTDTDDRPDWLKAKVEVTP